MEVSQPGCAEVLQLQSSTLLAAGAVLLKARLGHPSATYAVLGPWPLAAYVACLHIEIESSTCVHVCVAHPPLSLLLQVEYINLRGTSKENPAVCKYTGNKYYSDPHTWMAH